MEALNLPQYPFKIRKEEDKYLIFDELRKKELVLTPEEWVRQHFVQFLINQKQFAKGLIAIEKGLKLNELQKRADILCYNVNGEPIVLVECKAASVKINQEVFEQVARYNLVFKVPYLVVTNGLEHYCVKIDFENNSFEFLKDIPVYSKL